MQFLWPKRLLSSGAILGGVKIRTFRVYSLHKCRVAQFLPPSQEKF